MVRFPLPESSTKVKLVRYAAACVLVLHLLMYGCTSRDKVLRNTSSDSKVDAVVSLDDVRNRLLNGTDTDKKEVAAALRLNMSRWDISGTRIEDIPCDRFDSVETTYATLLQPGKQAVLSIHSEACQYTYLSVFDPASNGKWRYVDTTPIWSKYQEPTITLESLVEEGTKEIVAADCLVTGGNGVSQEDLVIFKLFQGGLQVVFKEPESVEQDVWVSYPDRRVKQSQDSEFRFIPPAGNDASATGVKEILEKQVLRDHALAIVRWRLYYWSPEIRRFEGVPTFPRSTLPGIDPKDQ